MSEDHAGGDRRTIACRYEVGIADDGATGGERRGTQPVENESVVAGIHCVRSVGRDKEVADGVAIRGVVSSGFEA